MRNILAITLAGVFALASVATNAAESLSHADLLKKVRDKERIQEQVNEQRVQQFRSQRNRQQQLLADAKARLAAEEAKSERLKAQFDENEKQLTQIAEDLRIKQGNLGELFGVVRQAANSMTGDIGTSLVSAQYPGRQGLLNTLTEADALPKMEQLRAFWVLMLQEMSEQGETTTFTADVVNEGGRSEQQTVTRVGTFNLVSSGEYLFFDKGVIKTLQVQPDSRVLNQVEEFQSTNSGYAGLFLDPSKGAILQLEKQKMSLIDRLWEFSGFAGKTVMVLLVIGLLIALERIFTLDRKSVV